MEGESFVHSQCSMHLTGLICVNLHLPYMKNCLQKPGLIYIYFIKNCREPLHAGNNRHDRVQTTPVYVCLARPAVTPACDAGVSRVCLAHVVRVFCACRATLPLCCMHEPASHHKWAQALVPLSLCLCLSLSPSPASSPSTVVTGKCYTSPRPSNVGGTGAADYWGLGLSACAKPVTPSPSLLTKSVL